MQMKDMITTKEAAQLWGLTQRRITGMCASGIVKGARKKNNRWYIPKTAERPVSRSFTNDMPAAKTSDEKLPLPIGISDYRLASSKYYYVDKTMMIKTFLDERPLVSLFTRPRRFGKTLNMDMMRVFFEKTGEDTSSFFSDKLIWNCGDKYRKEQGRYPVIFVTFKDIKFNSWADTFAGIKDILSKEANRHFYLCESDNCNEYDKKYLKKLSSGDITEVELSSAFLNLSAMLHKHEGIAPVIIIDEYDIPIQQGYIKGFYDEVILFMRNLFSGAFKDNSHLSYGLLTGILRVAKESIFSGLNNLSVNSVLDNKYSEYFGFTDREVRRMAQYYGSISSLKEIRDWYDGYTFGKTDIFNPWSVLNYFNNGCEPAAFWQATGSNDIIGEIIAAADDDIYEKLTGLLRGESVAALIDTGVIYPMIKSNPSTIYSFLLVAGYLKVVKMSVSVSGDYMCEVALPNKEIGYVYNKEILQRLESIIAPSTAILIQEAVYSGDGEKLGVLFQKLLTDSVSYYDTAGESFYHGFLLGLCALLDDAYLTSNRESGKGRYDLQLFPLRDKLPGILIELKAGKDLDRSALKALSGEALNQINNKAYDSEMRRRGVKEIYKYGVAFSGKMVEVETEKYVG